MRSRRPTSARQNGPERRPINDGGESDDQPPSCPPSPPESDLQMLHKSTSFSTVPTVNRDVGNPVVTSTNLNSVGRFKRVVQACVVVLLLTNLALTHRFRTAMTANTMSDRTTKAEINKSIIDKNVPIIQSTAVLEKIDQISPKKTATQPTNLRSNDKSPEDLVNPEKPITEEKPKKAETQLIDEQPQEEIQPIDMPELPKSYRIISPAKIVTIETILASQVPSPSLPLPLPDDSVHVMPNMGQVWLAGIIRDTEEIQSTVFQSMIQLNCLYNVSIHIVTSAGVSAGYDRYHETLQQLLLVGDNSTDMDNRHNTSNATCGQFIVQQEPKEISSLELRIDKIAVVRDFQRDQLRALYYGVGSNSSVLRTTNDLVILADLDLASFPNVTEVMRQISFMMTPPAQSEAARGQRTGPIGDVDEKRQLVGEDQGHSSDRTSRPYDAICATGLMHRPYGYYDIFATVLLPDTFVYPIRGRLTRSINDGEDITKIRSDDIYGEVTQFDLLDYFESQSRSADSGALHEHTVGNRDPFDESFLDLNQFVHAVPVRSCFGGFTIYDAAKYFNPECTYSARYATTNEIGGDMPFEMAKYASRRSKRPCEHVIFHNCLQRKDSSTVLAVSPRLRTEWNNRIVFGNQLPVGRTRHDGLNTYYNQRSRGERLVSSNGRYTLRINEEGMLVVEDWGVLPPSSFSVEKQGFVVWTSPVVFGAEITYWTHMFLWLKSDGSLQLIKHVPRSDIWQEKIFEQCEDVRDDQHVSLDNPCLCIEKIDGCEILMWSVDFVNTEKDKTGSSKMKFSLALLDDGTISIASATDAVLWEAKPSSTLPKTDKR